MEKISTFDAQQLAAISKILAHSDNGLTNTEIEYLLRDCRIPDPSVGNSKWKRVFDAFVTYQNEKQFGNHVIMFITRAMNPIQYTQRPHVFAFRRNELNVVLILCGMKIGEDGKIRRVEKARHLTEALERANRMHSALLSRKVHDDVLSYCRAEFLQENYFHAVFEAMKSIAAKIRRLSGLTTDGASLIQEAFGNASSGTPLMVINSFVSETEKGEQRGFVNLLVGLFGTIRNPLAHNAKIEWEMSEQDALDILTTASLIHRKLDKVRRTR